MWTQTPTAAKLRSNKSTNIKAPTSNPNYTQNKIKQPENNKQTNQPNANKTQTEPKYNCKQSSSKTKQYPNNKHNQNPNNIQQNGIPQNNKHTVTCIVRGKHQITQNTTHRKTKSKQYNPQYKLKINKPSEANTNHKHQTTYKQTIQQSKTNPNNQPKSTNQSIKQQHKHHNQQNKPTNQAQKTNPPSTRNNQITKTTS